MKKITYLLLLATSLQPVFSQNFEGKWAGILNVQGMQLHLLFTISKTEKGFLTTMDSPDQGAKNIPITETIVTDNNIALKIPAATISYIGNLQNDTINGVFTQNGQNFKMILTKSIADAAISKRPQEPQAPFSYLSEEVEFINKKEKIVLSGTLTLPKAKGLFAAVILISGSGPQNRNEELFGHKPFLVLADYLTKNGIAVLRYDDRGVEKSKGDFKLATSADFATDVESAIAYLQTRPEINSTKIGLIGHSEGGIIAPMVAAKNNAVNFIVLLAAPALQGDKLLLLQKEKLERALSIPENDIQKGQQIFSKLYTMLQAKHEDETIKSYLKTSFGSAASENEIDGIIKQLQSKWMQFYINYDPAIALKKVKCAVLALNGENDLQVPYQQNLNEIKAALPKAKNSKTTFKSYPKLNHLFQTSATGLPAEYQTIEETFAPIVLQDIGNWILQVTRQN